MESHYPQILSFIACYLVMITVVLSYVVTRVFRLNKAIDSINSIDRRLKNISNVKSIIGFYFDTIMDSHFKDDLVLKQYIRNSSLDDKQLEETVKEISVMILTNMSHEERVNVTATLMLKDEDDLVMYITRNVRDRVLLFIIESRKV